MEINQEDQLYLNSNTLDPPWSTFSNLEH